MWNKQLAECASSYPTAVLSIVQPDGFPASVRCKVTINLEQQSIIFADLPAWASDWQGNACLLFHQHDEKLESLRQLVILGVLLNEPDRIHFRAEKFVTTNGRLNSDKLPHASSPWHLLQFMWNGWRRSRIYLAKRTSPWPAIPYNQIMQAMKEEASK